LRLTLIAAAKGTDLSKAMRRNEEQARLAMPRVASALAELHGVDIDIDGRTHPVSSEALLLDAWVGLLEEMYPELGRKIASLTERLAACRPDPSPRPVLLHRDFYDKQILLGPEHVTLLDMDTVGFGDAELDVANFCVHVWLRGIQHDRRENSESLQAAFLAAYPSEIDASRLAWYRNATVLRLAGNYALRPRWRHVVDDLVTEAEKGLDAS
jgi:aminoglycoside phosphotransferase (APT) family kinase protein